ncbi:MAG: [protein-PII] uridylyltransferase [Burkholderiales bacterium]|nr:[protein-PII] uridylyltransferase [Burkholderiales bacterium]
MNPPSNRIKQELAEGRKCLQNKFQQSGRVSALLKSHSNLVDAQLKAAWESISPSTDVALLAVGGYGRRVLFPYSDIDLLILLEKQADAATVEKLERLVGLLWDSGLEVGHSVRTLEECVLEAKKDITVQTNMLEARLLAGRIELYRAFSTALRKSIDCRAFFNAKELEQQQRHMRLHGASHNLEPNLKESPGGLRDLQTLLWISKACNLGTSWNELAKNGIITRIEARQIGRHQTFLENLRIRLHYLAARREDRLLFDYQTVLATELGFDEKRSRRASEQLMQHYYRTAKSVSQLNTILLQNMRTSIFASSSFAKAVINERFEVRDDLLAARSETLFEAEPGAILECFLLIERHPELKGISSETLRALWRATARIDAAFRKDERNHALFMQILRESRGVSHALQRMNQYGVLGKYIPAFGRIVGRMQHDLFHVYTVDEHILKVVRNLRRFTMAEYAHEYPLCSRLINEFERPEVLYLAGLFHDIAKGRGGDHSKLGRRDALSFCKQHGMGRGDAELVGSLVENHLVMSSTAQKMDLSDPDVIANFAARVGTERQLSALYLLTVADIRGTSPTVWNAWKEKLLEDLFRAAQRCMRGDKPSSTGNLQMRQNEAVRLLQLYAMPKNSQANLWSKLGMPYFLQHDANEIAWHVRILYNRVDTGTPVVRARLSPIGEGLQVMIYAATQPDLFAQISGFFERIGYNIAEARIHATRHGYSLNSFLVLDPERKVEHYRDLISFIEYELGQRLVLKKPLEAPVQSRLSRHLKHFPIPPQVNIVPDEKGLYRVLSIIAGDRPGLLSRIARTLTARQIQVHSARINTLGERVEDTFLISGAQLEKQNTLIRIETELIDALQA